MTQQIINNWFNAFRQKDIALLEQILAPDFVHNSPFGEIEGGRTYLNLVKANTEAFFSPVIEVLDIIGDGGKFAVRYTVNGNPACDCIYVENGQIIQIHAYYHLGPRPSYDAFNA